MGINDAMAGTCLFLEAQGMVVKENVEYQDNQSAMLLENNGCKSSGKKTRYIEILYFFTFRSPKSLQGLTNASHMLVIVSELNLGKNDVQKK